VFDDGKIAWVGGNKSVAVLDLEKNMVSNQIKLGANIKTIAGS
jgi:hypothetical protein